MSHRRFQDENGIHWEVWDVRPSSVKTTLRDAGANPDRGGGFALPPHLRDGWLAFQSYEESRRLAPIPTNWSSLSDRELSRLAQSARLAPSRIARPEGRPPDAGAV